MNFQSPLLKMRMLNLHSTFSCMRYLLRALIAIDIENLTMS